MSDEFDVVIKLVDSMRQDLGRHIDLLSNRIADVITNHEHRITVIETHSSEQAKRLTRMSEGVDRNNEILTEIARDNAAQLAADHVMAESRKSKYAWRHWALGIAVSLLYIVVAALALL